MIKKTDNKQLNNDRWQTILRLYTFARNRLKEVRISEASSSMTLTTLLALVPVFALCLTIFAVFPAFESYRIAFEEMLFNTLLPNQYNEQIIFYVRQFSDHAQGLTTFGIAGFIVVALMLIEKIFEIFNRIFKVVDNRTLWQRGMIYWAILTLGPVFFTVSIVITSTLTNNMLQGLDTALSTNLGLSGQLLLKGIFLASLYKLVPNRYVKWTHALIGGGIVAVVSEIFKIFFSIYVVSSPLGSIYGAFVALPMFLLWIYMSWFLIFMGASIVASIPVLTSGRYEDSYKNGNSFLTGLAILKVMVERSRMGDVQMGLHTLCGAVDTYPEAAYRILKELEKAKFVVQVENETHVESHWALSSNALDKTVGEVVGALAINTTNRLVIERYDEEEHHEGLLFQWFNDFQAEKSLKLALKDFVIKYESKP